jgi:hypothetical protein
MLNWCRSDYQAACAHSERALEKSGVDKVVFNNWSKCARSAFIEGNLIAIPDLSLYGGNNKRIMMDPRCFIDHFINTL